MFELANHDKGAEMLELQHISIPWMEPNTNPSAFDFSFSSISETKRKKWKGKGKGLLRFESLPGKIPPG